MTRIEARSHAGPAPFSLSRWFTTVGGLAIVLLAVIGALLLSRLFEERMLLQEGRLTMQFVQGIIDVEEGSTYFESSHADRSRYMERLLAHVSRAPEVLRTNLYSRERRIIWSSEPALIGKSFAGALNAELDAALRGELEIHEEAAHDDGQEKAEHARLRSDGEFFIELYVPVWDPGRKNVVGAVELYRAPRLLQESISTGKRLIWAGAIGAAAFLYVALLPLVRRADVMIRDQQDRIVDAETLAAMGDLSSAVAHGMRNPLAVIRSSAEIVREGSGAATPREAAAEIMDQVDRLEHWVRELLTYVHLPAGAQELVAVESIVRESLGQFAAELKRRGIEAAVELPERATRVRGDAILLAQVFSSLISNALESMPQGGRLVLTSEDRPRGFVSIDIRDTGSGMSEEQLVRAMRPFHTTKSKGLGIGLPLARRIVERMGGQISLTSRLREGTTVRVALPVAQA